MEPDPKQYPKVRRPYNSNKLQCPICFDTIQQPVKCLKCRNAFCKRCCFRLERCPMCRATPFKTITYEKIFKVFKEIFFYRFLSQVRLMNNLKSGEFLECSCTLCNFRGHKEDFLEHLIGCHKKTFTDFFNMKIQTDRKKNIVTEILGEQFK